MDAVPEYADAHHNERETVRQSSVAKSTAVDRLTLNADVSRALQGRRGPSLPMPNPKRQI
jgi:hypothetical protein